MQQIPETHYVCTHLYLLACTCTSIHAQVHVCAHTGTGICSLIGLALTMLETENSWIICWQLQWE